MWRQKVVSTTENLTSIVLTKFRSHGSQAHNVHTSDVNGGSLCCNVMSEAINSQCTRSPYTRTRFHAANAPVVRTNAEPMCIFDIWEIDSHSGLRTHTLTPNTENTSLRQSLCTRVCAQHVGNAFMPSIYRTFYRHCFRFLAHSNVVCVRNGISNCWHAERRQTRGLCL